MISATGLTRQKYGCLFRQNCLLCGLSSEAQLCQTCKQDLPLLDWQRVPRDLLLWPKAADALGTVYFDKLLVCSLYRWPLDHLLTGLKFAQRLPNASVLGMLFYEHCLAGRTDLPQAIVPVPLHRARFRQRKYNQALELVKPVARLSGVPIEHQLCERTRPTVAQTELSGPQRRANLKQAFATTSPCDYRHVAIFDDIVTTGATVNSLCRTLKHSNPNMTVEVWCIALSLPLHQ